MAHTLAAAGGSPSARPPVEEYISVIDADQEEEIMAARQHLAEDAAAGGGGGIPRRKRAREWENQLEDPYGGYVSGEDVENLYGLVDRSALFGDPRTAKEQTLVEGEPSLRRLRSGVTTRTDVVPTPKRRSRVRRALDRLQDDLIVEIFLHLSKFPDLLRVRQVCRRWKFLSCDARLWRNLSFEGHENVSSRDVGLLFRDIAGLSQLQSLSLAKTHGVSEEAVRNIPRTQCAATLEDVDLSWCSGANDKSVVEYSRCPGLRVLRLSHCRSVSRRSVRILAVRCPRLEVLDLNCIGGIRDSLLDIISDNCPRLRVLNIANSRNVSDDGVASLAKGCRRLEVLDLSWCCKVSDWAISKVALSMPRLRDVGLSETRVTNFGIADLAKNCGQLEALHLARCVRISNDGAESIMKYCSSRISTLNIASCHSVSDDCVERLIASCPKLICLDVSKLPCRHISDMLQRIVKVRDIQVYF